MRTIVHGLWILGALGGAAYAVEGCQAPCSDSDSCGSYVPPGAGSGSHAGAGDAGDAGTANGGNAGANSAGGNASTGGTAGSLSGSAGEAGAGGGGITCDTSKDPSVEACLVDDDYAVFVAPGGKDNAAGTKSAPLATLSKAVEIAAGVRLVLVCDASFDEHVTVSRGARIYGGFRCADWSSEDGAPLFKPTTPGPALKVDGVTTSLSFTRLHFEVGDATSSGETALTAIVNASPVVTFDEVNLKAGKGKAGAAGTLTAFTFPDPSALNGNAETSAGVGGGGKACMCQPSLSSTGGVGGAPVAGGQSGSTGQPDLGAGKGGIPGSCFPTGGGADGADAPPSSSGAGASSYGTGSINGWTPSDGATGANGSPGQGGGGGASRNASGHGGGGGCGGCGGNGATGGKGGGGSIALLLINAPVELRASTLATSDAGDGGNGVAGQPGQQAQGSGGNTLSNLNSCGGGAGGKGGDGGASGGGAGGISVGIVWQGSTPPTLTDTTTTTGKAGAAGIGGVPGTNDGIAGLKQELFQAP